MDGSNLSEDLSALLLTGSEEMFDFCCQPCSSEQELEAAGYCQECSQYLCINCIKYHSKLASTAHHTVLDKSAMPRTETPQIVHNTDILTEKWPKCPKHLDRILEYFCPTHNQICCSVCVTLEHITCSGKSYIPEVSGGIEKSQEYCKLKADLDHLVSKISNKQEQINNDGKINEENQTKALADIKEIRKLNNELLDNMEEYAERKLAKSHQENVGIIESVSENYQSLLTEVNSMAADIIASAKSGKNNELFIQVKLFCNRLAEVDRQLAETGSCKLSLYSVNQDDKMQQLRSTLSTLWPSTVKHNTPTKARFEREVNAKFDGDSSNCEISGLALLDNRRMAVTDCDNNAVKLIDMKVNKVISSLSFSSKLFDITVMKSNQVAVLLRNGTDSGIGIITVSNTLSMKQTIKLPGAGNASLCYDGSNFIVAYQTPGRVKIINMSGKTLNTISSDGFGKHLFIKPRFIALSREKKTAYITDMDAKAVTSVTLRGQVNWVYRHEKLERPLGVAVGKDGSVYVCSKLSNTVHQLTPSGELRRLILVCDQGLAEWPYAIAYGEEENMLYISRNNSAPHNSTNYVGLYRLE